MVVGHRKAYNQALRPSRVELVSAPGIPMAEFIQRIIDGIRENWLNFALVGLVVGGIVLVLKRIGT